MAKSGLFRDHPATEKKKTAPVGRGQSDMISLLGRPSNLIILNRRYLAVAIEAHAVVKLGHPTARRLGEQDRHNRVDRTGEAAGDQAPGDIVSTSSK